MMWKIGMRDGETEMLKQEIKESRQRKEGIRD
jgi:hypothetical protein